MNQQQETVKVVFLDKTLIAVLKHDSDPLEWLRKNDFAPAGEAQFGTEPLIKAPVMEHGGGPVYMVTVFETPVEGNNDGDQ